MLQRLDKLAPCIAVALLGYLTYTTVSSGTSCPGEGKKLPLITKRMLDPELIQPSAGASRVGRDPFEVGWASYTQLSPARGAATRPATRPATSPAGAAAEPALPPLAEALTGVFLGGDLGLAVIGGKVHKVGSLIGGKDPTACWRVDAIEKDAVVIRFGTVRRVLRIAAPAPPVGGRRPRHE